MRGNDLVGCVRRESFQHLITDSGLPLRRLQQRSEELEDMRINGDASLELRSQIPDMFAQFFGFHASQNFLRNAPHDEERAVLVPGDKEIVRGSVFEQHASVLDIFERSELIGQGGKKEILSDVGETQSMHEGAHLIRVEVADASQCGADKSLIRFRGLGRRAGLPV